jgi:hypothetical protein
LAGAALIVAIGRAGSAGSRELTTRPDTTGPVTVDSMIEPHSLHSGQRPSHLAGWCPHASQTNAGRAAFGAVREVVTRTS